MCKSADALRSLEAILAESNHYGIVECKSEARLALGEIEMSSGKIAACLEGWRLHVFEGNFLHVDVDLWSGGVDEEFLDDVVLAIRVEDAVSELAVQEIEGFREVVLDRVAVTAVERMKSSENIGALARELGGNPAMSLQVASSTGSGRARGRSAAAELA